MNDNNNKEENQIPDYYQNEEINLEDDTEKKKRKKGLLYWIITILLILSIMALIATVTYNLFIYFSLKYTTDQNAITATEKYEPITCDPTNNTVSASYQPNSLNPDDYETNELIGYINAPTVDMTQPIYKGDAEDENVVALDKGAAFDTNSYLPQTGGYTVLSGHREYVFQPVKDLKEGDPIIVNIDGQVFTYQVTSSKVIGETDVDEVFLNDDSETLILYTCYPFFLLAPYTDRYVVYAEPVESVEYPDCQ